MQVLKYDHPKLQTHAEYKEGFVLMIKFHPLSNWQERKKPEGQTKNVNSIGLWLSTGKNVWHCQLPTRCSTLIYVNDMITIQLKLVLFAWNKMNNLYKQSDAMKGRKIYNLFRYTLTKHSCSLSQGLFIYSVSESIISGGGSEKGKRKNLNEVL